jgi:hypothetical protein
LPFWEALKKPEATAVPVSIGDRIGQRQDTSYVSYYDIYILDQIWMAANPLSLLGQEAVKWPFGAVQFYEQRLPGRFQTPAPAPLLSESRLLRRRYHDELRFEGIDRFELLPLNDESLEILDRETKWFQKHVRKLRNRMRSFRQLERDVDAAKRFYLAMLPSYIALATPAVGPSNIHDHLFEVAYPRFAKHLKRLVRFDVRRLFEKDDGHRKADEISRRCAALKGKDKHVAMREAVKIVKDVLAESKCEMLRGEAMARYDRLFASHQKFLGSSLIHFWRDTRERKGDFISERTALNPRVAVDECQAGQDCDVFNDSFHLLTEFVEKDDSEEIEIGVLVLVMSRASRNIIDIVKCQCETEHYQEHLNRAIEALRKHLSQTSLKSWETYLKLLEATHARFEEAKERGFAFDRDIESPITEFFDAISKGRTRTD